jgi:DNA polymerase-3 subunit beta
MKLTIQREVLLKPLQLLSGVIEKKQMLPILSNVLIKVEGNQLSIIGADTDIEVTICAPVDYIEEPESFTVSANKLMDICRALPERAMIEFTYRNKNIFIQSGQSNFSLATLPVSDFPLMNAAHIQTKIKINRTDLLYLLKLSSFAMAQQDVRYYLNGMLWEIEGQNLQVVSTDGHRMAVALINTVKTIEKKQDNLEKIIVPRKAIFELMRFISDSKEELTLAISPQSICISDTKFSFHSRLIDGRFPDYKKVIPQTGDKKIIFDRNMLKNALTRISILSNQQLRAVCFQFKKNKLCLYANNVEQETAEERIDINYDKEDLEVVFNVNYLLDIVSVCQEDKIYFLFKDANSSVLIEALDSNYKAFFVVMPMCL